jgi:hypothetical protein
MPVTQTTTGNMLSHLCFSDCDGEKMEDQVENLEDARKVIKSLHERYRAQSHQLLAWRRRVKAQVYYSPVNPEN